VGLASGQWGGRPRPPTDMAARDSRPTNTQAIRAEGRLCLRR
jgi:hypothetical protein